MTAYEDLDSPQTMTSDAVVVDGTLSKIEPTASYADLYATYPMDVAKPQIQIGAAAQRIAAALDLHLG